MGHNNSFHRTAPALRAVPAGNANVIFKNDKKILKIITLIVAIFIIGKILWHIDSKNTEEIRSKIGVKYIELVENNLIETSLKGMGDVCVVTPRLNFRYIIINFDCSNPKNRKPKYKGWIEKNHNNNEVYIFKDLDTKKELKF